MTTIDLLLSAMDEAYDRRSWHGTNLRGSIRGLSLAQVSWRPAPGRHNIWETVVHAAYWKYTVKRRLLGDKPGSFPLKGSNWFTRPAAGAKADARWKADVALLAEMHQALRAAVAAERPETLDAFVDGETVTRRFLITGIIAHDLYHAGQIQLLKKLQGGRAARRA
jgi:uncharacterized damage-inducible protein DinB